MIKSKFISFGFCLCVGMIVIGIWFFLSSFSDARTVQQKYVLYGFVAFVFIFFGSMLWREAKIILIDCINKTITFTNLFTRVKTINSFDDFDGYIDCYQSAKGGSYRVIYLVKDKKFVKKISSFYYSNLDEIQNGIAPMKYFGQQDFGLFKSIRVLFGLPVLK
jgi:hypothetical protein